MLAFKLDDETRTITIFCDDAGIEVLVGTLLRMKGSYEEIHLHAPLDDKDKSADLSIVTPFGEPAITDVFINHGGD